MSARSPLALAWPVALAGALLSAHAQTQAPAPQESTAARDNTMIEASFAQADANNDGRLSREEAASVPGIGARFDELDKDRDGTLSLLEFAAGFAPAK